MTRFLTIFAMSVVLTTGAFADDLPQTTSDGLVRVQDPKVAIAYVRPNTDWAKYKTIKLEPLVVPDKVRNTAPKGEQPEFGESFMLRDDDVAALQKAYMDVTRDELTKAGFTIVDTAGPDTLVVSPQIDNITLTAPLDRAGMAADGPGLTLTQGAGSMAMQSVLKDGASSTVVAIGADRKVSNQPWGINDRAENLSEARSAFGAWARDLASAVKTNAASKP